MAKLLRESCILLILLSSLIALTKANFEDTRCRCTCPSTEYFSSKNITTSEHYRRYYTKANLDSANCNAQSVVKRNVLEMVDDAKLDAFLANCNCRFESRNSLLLKVVVIFVIGVIFLLGSYMVYLGLVEPMVRRQQPFIPYQRHDGQQDDAEENIFSQPDPSASEESVDQRRSDLQMRARHSAGLHEKVISKVVAEQNKWKMDVEEQRRNVLNHSMLN